MTNSIHEKALKLGSHQLINFWRQKLKLSPLLFPGDNDIFKVIFLYHTINFYRQLIPTKTDIITKLRRKSFFEKTKRWQVGIVHCFWYHQLWFYVDVRTSGRKKKNKEDTFGREKFSLKIGNNKVNGKIFFVNFLMMIVSTITGIFA